MTDWNYAVWTWLLVTIIRILGQVWGKVIFSVACVKNSVHRGVLPQCMLGYCPPPDQAPSRPGNPHDQAPSQSRSPLPRADTQPTPGEQTHNPWGADTQPLGSRHTTPGEQTPSGSRPPRADPPDQAQPPCAMHAGRYSQQAGGTHPTGMQSCWTKYQAEFSLLMKRS